MQILGKDNGGRNTGGSCWFSTTAAIILAQFFGVAAIALMLVWLLHFRDGVALHSDINQQLLNMHHLLMFLGLVFLMGQGMIAYKTVPASRRVQKFFHMTIHLVGLVLGALGLFAIFQFKNHANQSNLYTLHSWLGIATISLYALQWLLGFLIFLSPGASFVTRASFLPWHFLLGVMIFLLAIVSSETGIMERFLLLGLRRGQEALVLNFTAVAILLYGLAIFLVLNLPSR